MVLFQMTESWSVCRLIHLDFRNLADWVFTHGGFFGVFRYVLGTVTRSSMDCHVLILKFIIRSHGLYFSIDSF